MSLTQTRRTTATRRPPALRATVAGSTAPQRSPTTSAAATASIVADEAVIEQILERLTAPGAPAQLQRAMLRNLDQRGSLTAAELPRQWPVTRQHVRDALRILHRDGLVEPSSEIGGRRSYQLTALGRGCLERIDWSSAVALEVRAQA